MRRTYSPGAAEEIGRTLDRIPLVNRRRERVRGLRLRDGIHHVQVNVRGWTGQVRLHASNVAEAVAARQVVKSVPEP